MDFLRARGVDTVFGLPDDDLGLLAALADRSDDLGDTGTGTDPGSATDPGTAGGGPAIRMVLCRSQRNAVFMAAGHALAGGRPACCVVGRGPGLAAALPGLVEAAAGRVPLLLLAAGTAGGRLGTGAFQELDQLALVRPAVKSATRVEAPERLYGALERAWWVASTGAPGPVYLELPDHMATEPVPGPVPDLDPDLGRPGRRPAPQPPAPAAGPAADACAHLLRTARRPVLLVGGGLRGRNPDRRVERLAEALGAAIAVTASGRGTVDEAHPLFCGLSGLYAPKAAAPLWRTADLVVALGSRLEETAVHGWSGLAAGARVIQVNTEPADFAPERPGPLLLGDAAAAVAAWLRDLPATPGPNPLAAQARTPGVHIDGGAPTPATDAAGPSWRALIHAVREQAHRDAAQVAAARRGAGGGAVRVVDVLDALDRVLPADRILVQENGLADMWSYCWPHWRCPAPGGSVVPSEQTSLGFGAAAAVGVQLAVPGRPVAALVGDGAFASLGADLLSADDAGAGVLYVVLDNGGYGWLQHALDTGGPGGSTVRFTRPAGRTEPPAGDAPPRPRVERPQDLPAALAAAWRRCRTGRPAVVEVAVRLDDLPPLPADVLAPVPGTGPATTAGPGADDR